MNTDVAERPPQDIAAAVEAVIARGDLSLLTPEQKVYYYNKVCESLSLNPLTQPFKYMKLSGKEVLYPAKDCTDQLRKLNSINIEIADYAVTDGLLTVHARAIDKSGRKDEDYGVVSVAGLRGEAASNAFMKAVTKAKRRVTLSISGLGFPEGPADDDDEVQSYPSFKPAMPARDRAHTPIGNVAGEGSGPDVAQEAAAEPAAVPFTIPRADDDKETWSQWMKTLMAYIRAAPNADAIGNWTTENADHLQALQQRSEQTYGNLIAEIKKEMDAKPE
jgi:hypothetical protein